MLPHALALLPHPRLPGSWRRDRTRPGGQRLRPSLNLGLLAAVFVALNAPRDTALPACFLVGLLQDCFSVPHPVGVFAFAYGLVGYFVANIQDTVYREHPLTHLTLTLIGGFITWLIVAVNAWVYGWLHRGDAYAGQPLLPLLGIALYTALLSPSSWAFSSA